MPRVFMAARLPDGGELTFRLSLTDSADPSGGNPRHPFEDKTLALFDELRTPLLRYVLSPHRETAIWETWHYPLISVAILAKVEALRLRVAGAPILAPISRCSGKSAASEADGRLR
jgi:hypothetical protein